jgi:DNA-binding CsgD family transcriptional regulator
MTMTLALDAAALAPGDSSTEVETIMAKQGTTQVALAKVSRLLARSRWTVVGSYESNGQLHVVAREESADGVATLTDRERQAVACLAEGQSTKETAYALGIADVTVRVLLRRAATKLGARSRRELLEHDDVRALRSRVLGQGT